MNVVNLKVKMAKKVTSYLVGLTARSKEEAITGIVVLIKVGPDNHLVSVVGDYADHPEQAMQGIFNIERQLRRDMNFHESR